MPQMGGHSGGAGRSPHDYRHPHAYQHLASQDDDIPSSVLDHKVFCPWRFLFVNLRVLLCACACACTCAYACPYFRLIHSISSGMKLVCNLCVYSCRASPWRMSTAAKIVKLYRNTKCSSRHLLNIPSLSVDVRTRRFAQTVFFSLCKQ